MILSFSTHRVATHEEIKLTTASSELRKLTGTLDIDATTSPVSISFNPNKVKNKIYAHKWRKENVERQENKKKSERTRGDFALMQLAKV